MVFKITKVTNENTKIYLRTKSIPNYAQKNVSLKKF